MSIAEIPGLAEPKIMTVEEFLALPDDGIDRELIRGKVKEYGMTIRNRFHSTTEAMIVYFLLAWLEGQPEPKGFVASGESGFWLKGTKESARWYRRRLRFGRATGIHPARTEDFSRPTRPRGRDSFSLR